LKSYSIKEICEIVGIKSHILRAWEHRYKIFSPTRCKSNIRQYTEDDLQYLQKILRLRKEGLRISVIAGMSMNEVTDLDAQVDINRSDGEVIDEVIVTILEMRECDFCKLWKRETERYGTDETLTKVIFPTIERLNLLWVSGSLNEVQDNFFARLLQRKLFSLMAEIDTREPTRPDRFLIYMPYSNAREISLHLTSYYLRRNGYTVYDLGVLKQLDEVRDAIKAIKPSHIYTQLPDSFPVEIARKYVDDLVNMHISKDIIVTTTPFLLERVPFHEHIKVFESVRETIQYINHLN